MSSPTVVDFPKLLAEIPASSNGQAPADPNAPAPAPNPAGIDLRADRTPPSLYDVIREARKAARAAEDTLPEPGKDPVRPDWKPVHEQGLKALAEKTKDLEIAAYLIEALQRLHGFPGLRDGFRLARELVEKYWDRLYPLPDEDGVTTRIAALAQVLRSEGRGEIMTAAVAKISLTEANTPDERLTLDHYQKALQLENVTDAKARQRMVEQGAVTLEQIKQRVAEAKADFYPRLAADLVACQDELVKLGLALDQKCGSQAPATSNLKEQLTKCQDALKDVAGDRLATAAPDAKPADDKGAKPAGPAAQPVDAIRDREDALRVLVKVADFFKKTEPHSFVSYAVEQAVRWGRMPLPDLLSELIPDDAPRKNLFQRVGIKGGEGAKSEKK